MIKDIKDRTLLNHGLEMMPRPRHLERGGS